MCNENVKNEKENEQRENENARGKCCEYFMMHFGLDSAIDVNNNLNNNFALFSSALFLLTVSYLREGRGMGTPGARTYAII